MRDRKYIGASDRRAISAVVFLSLRCMLSADTLWRRMCESESDAAALSPDLGTVICTLLLAKPLHCTEVLLHIPELRAAADFDLSLVDLCRQVLIDKANLTNERADVLCTTISREFTRLTAAHSSQSLSLVSSLPEWMCERWEAQGQSPDEIRELGQSLLQPAPLCIRVNTMLCTRDQILNEFKRLGIECRASNLSPHGVVLRERTQLTQLELFKSGYIEVQDESSQLVGFALNPKPNWRILDACAGAGGKSLHLAVLQADKGEIIASDVEPKRMRELYARARKAHLDSIQLRPLQSMNENERSSLHGNCDAVLIDAPCTGMGTVRRSPMLKWRLSADALQRMSQKQRDIIREYASYVRVGGVLLYVTCSLMREENEAQVESFLADNPNFCPSSLITQLPEQSQCKNQLSNDDWTLKLDPLHHGSDGFFIARMERIA